MRKKTWRLLFSPVAVAIAVSLLIVGCAAEPSAQQPTTAPAPKAEAPTTAPAAATTAPAAATTAPAASPTQQVAGSQATPVAGTGGYPERGRAITVIVPWDAGGSTDIGARVLAPAMERILGTPMQIVNRGGAASQVGVTELSRAQPDGYTVGWTNLPSSMSPYLDPSRNAAYGRDDLVQIANVVADPEVFAVRAESDFQTLDDLLEAARATPEEVRVSVTGIGSDNHLSLLMFQELADVRFNIVNFDGGAPAMTALLGDHVDANFQTLGNYPTHVKSGAVRFLGIADEERSPFPEVSDVPTLREQGHDLVYASSRGISAPAGTPQEAIDALSDAVREAMDDPQVQQTFRDSLLTTRFMDAEEYTQYWDDFESQTRPVLEDLLATQKK